MASELGDALAHKQASDAHKQRVKDDWLAAESQLSSVLAGPFLDNCSDFARRASGNLPTKPVGFVQSGKKRIMGGNRWRDLNLRGWEITFGAGNQFLILESGTAAWGHCITVTEPGFRRFAGGRDLARFERQGDYLATNVWTTAVIDEMGEGSRVVPQWFPDCSNIKAITAQQWPPALGLGMELRTLCPDNTARAIEEASRVFNERAIKAMVASLDLSRGGRPPLIG